MGLFAVLLRDPRGAEFPLVSKILGDFLNVPAIDAQHKARDAWGFLGEKLSAEEAQRLAAGAQAAGAPARVVPDSELAVSPPSQSANGGGPADSIESVLAADAFGRERVDRITGLTGLQKNSC